MESSEAQELENIRSILQALEYRSPGGLVRGGAERFVAEIASRGGVRRFSWLNPDSTRPLPETAAEMVQWVQDFSRKEGGLRIGRI